MAFFPTPTQIQTDYFTILKAVKPSLNTNDSNSDFVIRGKVFGGVASGLYGDQAKVRGDTWISTQRPEALVIEGQDYGIPQQPATQALSPQVRVFGVNGTVINPGDITFLYVPTNVLYSNTTGGTVSGGQLDVQMLCEIAGQIGNIQEPDVLTVVSPPTGITTSANVIQSAADGADIESTDSYRSRLLTRKQNAPAGGNETDYPQFAFAASPTVRSATIHRFGRGLGTVDVYITTGTTDIDSAITNGLSIVRIPSSGTIATVQAYYNTHVPLTDCPGVFAPSELGVPVTVNVLLANGLTLSSIPSDPVNNPLSLNVQQLIQREIARPLYKYATGGRVLPGGTTGYVIAADLEENLDVWLSSAADPVTGIAVGKIPILADRQVQKLNGTSWDLPLGTNQLAAPSTTTVVVGGLP